MKWIIKTIGERMGVGAKAPAALAPIETQAAKPAMLSRETAALVLFVHILNATC